MSSPVSFNSADWKNQALVFHKPFVKSQMINDLMARHRLVGMPKRDIDSLLGTPESTFPGTYHYFLCPDGCGDALILELEFDSSGKVITAKKSNN